MSGEKDRVKDTDSAKQEAKNDAEQIKNAGSTEESYKKFKQELDDMGSSGVDKSVITEYRKSLAKELGADFNKRMAVEFLGDAEGGQKLKNAQGVITKQNVTDRAMMGNINDDLSETEKMVLPQVYINFDPLTQANTGDGYGNFAITAADVESSRAGYKAEIEKNDAIEKNKKAGIAEALVDPAMKRVFKDLDIANQWTSSADGYASKGDLERFLNENQNYPESEKKAMETLKWINDNWDSEQVKQLRGGTDYLTRDSIAAGCGYQNAADFETQFKVKKDQPSQPTQPAAERDATVARSTTVDYQGAKRTFNINKDGQLLSYTEVKDGATSEFTVDKDGNVKKGDTVVATNASFNETNSEFKYKYGGKDVAEPALKPGETTQAVKSETEPTTITLKYGEVERTYTLNANKQLTGYTEKKGNVVSKFSVNPDTGLVTNTATNESPGNVTFDATTGKLTNNFKGENSKVTETPDAPPQAESDIKNKALLSAAKQRSGQGYWQVAEEMLKATKGENDTAESTRAENIILMRALQLRHKEQRGNLREHIFVKSQSDLAKLNEDIETYVKQHPSFAKYKEALQKKLAKVEAS